MFCKTNESGRPAPRTVMMRALAWAAIMISMALAVAYGVIGKDMGETLIIVLPIVATLSVFSAGSCNLRRKPQ